MLSYEQIYAANLKAVELIGLETIKQMSWFGQWKAAKETVKNKQIYY